MKAAVAGFALAAFLFAQLPARAGMSPAPKAEGGESGLQGERMLGFALPGATGDQLTAGASFLETYQLITIAAVVLTAGILLIAILGYGLFNSKKDNKREDDLRDLP
jgi:hypothetical protein